MTFPFDPSLIRREYTHEIDLEDSFCEQHPHEIFKRWLHEAVTGGVLEADAMNLATFDGKNVNARTVALRGITDVGLLVFTNFNSRKAREMDMFPKVALTFHWKENFRQVRMRGVAKKTTDEMNDTYFATRPRGSQVAAWVSHQSEDLTSRQELLEEYEKFDSELGDVVARPPFWGGYEITIVEYDFMQGRNNRLHDRFRFTQDSKGEFVSQRLWP